MENEMDLNRPVAGADCARPVVVICIVPLCILPFSQILAQTNAIHGYTDTTDTTRYSSDTACSPSGRAPSGLARRPWPFLCVRHPSAVPPGHRPRPRVYEGPIAVAARMGFVASTAFGYHWLSLARTARAARTQREART